MQRALAPESDHQLSMTVGGNVWRMYVYGVTRVGRELFIQAALFGPRTCTAIVRVTARRTRRQAAHEALALITDWLESGDPRDHVFLESADALAAC